MEIAEKIKMLRRHYRLSQEELASIAHVTKAAVSLWELGNTNNLKTGAVKAICEHYPELNPVWFLGDRNMFRSRDSERSLLDRVVGKLKTLDDSQLRKVEMFIDEFL